MGGSFTLCGTVARGAVAEIPPLEDLLGMMRRSIRLLSLGQNTYKQVTLEGKGHYAVMYVQRNDRPERKEAIAALVRFLDENPDLRIGQAVAALAGKADVDPFQLEDVELIHAVRYWPRNPGE